MKKTNLALFSLIFPLLFSPLAAFSSIAATSADNSDASNFEKGQALIKLKADSTVQDIVENADVIASPIVSPDENENLALVKSLDQKSTENLVQDLKKNPAVETAQPNFKYKPLANITNDPLFSSEWWLQNTDSAAGGIAAVAAWSSETKRTGNATIAVLDTGANYSHKDLSKNLTKGSLKGRNFENPKKKPIDSDGHGSFMSGIIAAISKNKRGLASPSLFNHLKIMPLRFDFTTSQAISAINFAKAKNIPVINASWGGYGNDGFDTLLEDAISQYPGVFVTASGNSVKDHDSGDFTDDMYPCDFDLANIICVAASDRNGALADYSDYGLDSVDLAAPGGTDDDPITSISNSKSRYASAVGSSISTAFVSAEAGILKSRFPSLTTAQIVAAILNSVDAEPSMAGKTVSGGKANISGAISAAQAR